MCAPTVSVILRNHSHHICNLCETNAWKLVYLNSDRLNWRHYWKTTAAKTKTCFPKFDKRNPIKTNGISATRTKLPTNGIWMYECVLHNWNNLISCHQNDVLSRSIFIRKIMTFREHDANEHVNGNGIENASGCELSYWSLSWTRWCAGRITVWIMFSRCSHAIPTFARLCWSFARSRMLKQQTLVLIQQ